VIWNSVIQKLDTFDPKLSIGYGLNGQVSSGVSEGYLDMFIDKTSDSEALLVQAHSNFYQLILDMGYLGALVYLILFYVLFRAQAKRAVLVGRRNFNGVMTLAGMLYILLIGLTSVTLYYTSTMLIFSWFLMILMLTVVEIPGRLKGNRRYQLAAPASGTLAGITSRPPSVPGLAGLHGAGSSGLTK
jgi:O-antigen ligase